MGVSSGTRRTASARAQVPTHFMRLLHSGRMNGQSTRRHLSVPDMEAILAVTGKLAAPFDLMTMLAEVVSAAKQVLNAERGSVWLYDAAADQLVLEIATGIPPVRVPSSAGLVGACARTRRIINVPDCYADPRFDRDVDRASGYRTRCMLTLPLVDHHDVLVGVMQVLNKADGVFDETDEALATVLAAQCAVALQRVRMTEALIEGEKMRQELEMARVVQMSTLPAVMPALAGYDVCGTFRPAEPDRRRHLRPRADRPGPARRAGRRHRPRHRARAVGHADARDAAHGVPPRRRPRDRVPAGQQPARRDARRRPLHHRFHRRARRRRPPAALPQRRPGADPALPAPRPRLRARYKPTSFPLGGDAAGGAAAGRQISIWRPATSSCCCPTASTSTANADGEQFGEAARRGSRAPRTTTGHGGAVGRAARGGRRPSRKVRRRKTTSRSCWSSARPRGPRTASSRRTFDALRGDRRVHRGNSSPRTGIDPGLLPTVDLALEELFTNMVKYSPGGAADITHRDRRDPRRRRSRR